MTKFRERILKIVEKLITTCGVPMKDVHAIVVKNNELLRDSRKGDYLIKTSDKEWGQIEECQYLHWGYTNSGSNTWGMRREAQWFSREEAVELISKYRGLRMVKRHSNIA